MVSSEGACAAYYLYRRLELVGEPELSQSPGDGKRPRLRRLGLPGAAAGHTGHRDGPRRRGARCRPSWLSTSSCPPTAAPPTPSSGTRRWCKVARGRLAFSTDSFVVKPMFFPGGSIGDLAVNGTVNDLAMAGATPLVPVHRVHPGRRHRPSPTSAGSPPPWARRPRWPRSRWSPATPRSSTAAAATGSTSTPPAWAWCRTGSRSARTAPRSAMSC